MKIAYDHGETFAMFYVGRYIDLDAQQSALTQERIRSYLYWHKKNELPDYVAFAENLRPEALQGLTAADQGRIEGTLREKAYRALNRALPDLADIALSLKPEQLQQTREKFADNDSEYKEKFVDSTPERRARDRADLWQERIEYWYGDLAPSQRAALKALSDAQPVDSALMLLERQSRENEFVELLTRIARDKPARGEVMQQMAAFARRCESSPDPKRRAYLETYKASNSAIFVRMSNLATLEQRRNAVKKLDEWISDMRAAQAD